MSSHNKHNIRNLNLEVEFQQQDDAFTLRNTLAEVCKTELLPALEKLFDEKVQRGKVIKAEEIVIDLGTIHQKQWNRTLVEQVIKELAEHFNQAAVSRGDTSFDPTREDETGEVIWERPNTITEMREEDNSIQAILHFLKTGLLPWDTVIKSQGEFVQHVSQLMNNPRNHLHKQILVTVRNDQCALIRLVEQVPEYILKSLTVQSGITTEDIRLLLDFWTKIFEYSKISGERVIKIVYRAAVGMLSEVFPEKPSIESINENVIEILTGDHHQKIVAGFTKPNQSFTAMDEVERKMFDAIRNLLTEKTSGSEGTTSGKTRDAQKSSTPATEGSRTNENSHQGRSRKKLIKDTGDGLFIGNAGLAILHPFLASLFGHVGYVEERKWISEKHQQRAILLTQYLVTGNQDYPEFDLLLNKLLTGYPLENSLPADIQLSDFEIQEAEDVLKSVLTHWKVLKNTSMAGLQSTFLQREGKLQFSDDRWLLQIERKTVDILLDKLPWGIGIIKLPWMESRLHVEWA